MFFSELHICVYCGKDIPLTLSFANQQRDIVHMVDMTQTL